MDPHSAERRARFEALFRSCYPKVRRYLLRRASDDVADDVLAQTFLVAWRRLDEVRGDPLAWMLAVARRTLANELRASTRRGALTERLQGADTAPPEPPHPLDPQLREALLGLPQREREALLLVAWEGLTPRQGAVVTACSRAAFRARLYRARRRLQAALENEETISPPHTSLEEVP